MSDHSSHAGNGQVLTEPDETPAGGLAIVVTIGVLIVVATIALVHGLYEQFDRDQLTVKSEAGYGAHADEVFTAQEARLSDYGLGDLQRGTYAIPIEEAGKLVISELTANPEANVTGPAPPPPAPAAPVEGAPAAPSVPAPAAP